MNLKLAAAPDETYPSPLRQVLAAAIEDAATAERAVEDCKVGLARSEVMVTDAAGALEAATAEVLRTKQECIEAAATAGGQCQPDRSMREARLREADATDGLEIAKGARATIAASLPELEWQLDRAKIHVQNAARAIMIAAAPEVMAKAETLYRELEAVRDVMSFLHNCFGFPPSHDSRTAESVARRMLEEPDRRRCTPWLQAFDALTRDANTPLPDHF